jgi:hypothetical protein
VRFSISFNILQSQWRSDQPSPTEAWKFSPAKTMSMASGSAPSSCSKVKYRDGDTSNRCSEYTVFILSKKLVRFVFLNTEGGLAKCDMAPGSKGPFCTFFTSSGAYDLTQYVEMTYSFAFSAEISNIKIT